MENAYPFKEYFTGFSIQYRDRTIDDVGYTINFPNPSSTGAQSLILPLNEDYLITLEGSIFYLNSKAIQEFTFRFGSTIIARVSCNNEVGTTFHRGVSFPVYGQIVVTGPSLSIPISLELPAITTNNFNMDIKVKVYRLYNRRPPNPSNITMQTV